jgi:glucuronate isomerase
VDSLEHHIALANDKSFNVKVLPAFRPDKSFNIEKAGFVEWIQKLGEAAGQDIKTFADVKNALTKRIEFFHEAGCRVSDHALDPVLFAEATEEEGTAILQKALQGQELSETEVKKYKTLVMVHLGKQYSRLGWVMQMHIGTIRNNSKRMMRLLGPDTGFDSIADYTFSEALAKLMDKLDDTDELPKTILYCLNPRDNEVLGTIIGCFQGGGIPGKIQFGSGWWFNDQKDGMIRQMVALANLGLLSRFVGMLTDSRSFLSYTRHEYFRRILCNLLGEWVEAGEVPNDIKLLGAMVQNICFNNAENYFGIEL